MVVRGSLSQFRLSARAFRRERKRPFLDPGASPLSELLSERPLSASPTPLVLLPGCMLLGARNANDLQTGPRPGRRKSLRLRAWLGPRRRLGRCAFLRLGILVLGHLLDDGRL